MTILSSQDLQWLILRFAMEKRKILQILHLGVLEAPFYSPAISFSLGDKALPIENYTFSYGIRQSLY